MSKKYKFKLLAGRYSYNASEDPIKPQNVMFGMGDIIETDLELDKMFNSPGSTKFERLSSEEYDTEESLKALEDDIARRKAALLEKKNAPQTVEDAAKKGFRGEQDVEKMTLVELQELAAANGISLGKAKNRDEVLRVIKNALVEA